MAIMTVSIDLPAVPFDKRSSEVAFIERALDVIKTELGRGNGNVTSGTILDHSMALGAPISLGFWTYTPSATNP
jgi:hypothetical protein